MTTDGDDKVSFQVKSACLVLLGFRLEEKILTY